MAQQEFIRKYKINTSHKTHSGLDVPSGFFIVVDGIFIQTPRDNFRYKINISSFLNQSKMDEGQNMIGIDFSFLDTTFHEKSDETDAVDLLTGNTDRLIKPQLEDKFGATNIQEVQ